MNYLKNLNLSAKDYNFFLSKIYFTSYNGSQNMFFYQPSFTVLELNKDRGTGYIICWKSKRMYDSKLSRHYMVLFYLT